MVQACASKPVPLAVMAEMQAGWDIKTAIARLVPNKDRSRWDTAERACEDASNASSPSWFSGGRDALDENDAMVSREHRLRRARDEAREVVLATLKRLGQDGLVVGEGRRNAQAAEPEIIPADRWIGFSEFNEKTSILCNGPSGFYSVLVFPALAARDASERISGKILLDILHDFVLRDPEIEALYAGQACPAPLILCDVVGEAGDGACLVPMTGSARAMKAALRSMPAFQGKADQSALPDAVLDVLAARLAALGGLLIDGAVTVRAITDGDPDETFVSLSSDHWGKPSCRLCLATGDIWQEREGQKARLFHSVRVERPSEGASSPSGAAVEGEKRNTGGKPPDASLREAFDALIAREFEAVGHDFESGASFARDLTDMWARQQKTKLSDEDREVKIKSMTAWVRDNYPKLWGMLKRGPIDPPKSK